MTDPSILIVGGGAVGLGIGWELVRQGRPVTIFDRGLAGRGASWLAAGMLAADAELQFEEPELYRLSRESMRRWPDFARALEAAAGDTVDYRDEGTLLVADDPDSAAALRRRYTFQKEQGLAVEWLTGAEALEREPFLAPRLAAAVFAPDDHQVDNRRVLEACKRAFVRAGGVLREHTPVQAVVPDAAAPAVVTEAGERIEGGTVILAAGAWSRQVEGLEPDVRPPVRPVKGQMIELRVERPFALRHVVRGPQAYLAPKSDGRVLVGATSEEMGFDTRVTAGGLYTILEGAWEIVPGIYDLPVTDTWAGLRPASRDHAPILGMAAPGVVVATGHYRHGILLMPVTAQEVARLVLTGETSPWLQPFSPRRFSTHTPASPLS
ncbi:MAG: glycine oxidase ThiO [Bacteroidetes bacterium]|nr:MAG: glycine oxidase ThiO [Bacteroidota bacterium]